MRIAAYLRVSSALQGDSGLGLEAQERAVRASAGLRGLEVGETIKEVVSGAARSLPLRDEALARCRAGELDGLIVAKLDRLARDASGLLKVAADAEKHGYRVLIADPQLVMPGETAADRMFIGMLAVFAEFERGLLRERTQAALAEARARGTRLGRPSRLSDETVAEIMRMHEAGLKGTAIARVLNQRGVPSATGKEWRHSAVNHIVGRRTRQTA
jgi:DNA invertase Pin-like site-specific DNA recombinase